MELNTVKSLSRASALNNIIPRDTLKEVQADVLRDLKDAISNSMGPAGSNTLILRGNNDQDLVTEYSKDGNKIIKHIKYQNPIEMSVKSEVENATRHIEKTVGDGTSTVVVMSSYIFDGLLDADKNGKLPTNPYEVSRTFDKLVKELSEEIRKSGRECTLDDIYDIAFISTNGNKEIAGNIRSIYEEYGMDVFIDVSATTDGTSNIKAYDGVTLETGYSDPCMINDLERQSARIRSTADNRVRVYYFQDPLDTNEMDQFFQKIIETNIIGPASKGAMWKPTVIMVPKIGRDSLSYMRRLTQFMHQYPESAYSQKPQILIVTNYFGLPENYAEHIATLCGASPIRKYIDNAKYESDVKAGLAPTIDNIIDFCGYCGEVEATSGVTKFVNPSKMYEIDKDGNILLNEDGNPINSSIYNNIITFLEAELKNARNTGSNAGVLGSLKRQLNAVKANMVEFFVGGISISDRDAVRDLVEDAVLNCRSAATNGVGYGANILGLISLFDKKDEMPIDSFGPRDSSEDTILDILRGAYFNAVKSLYRTKFDEETAEEIVNDIIEEHKKPVDIISGEPSDIILTSIESEPMILNTISKIITIMFTSNQALLQAPSLTQYYER
jgi:60 kDa chaperonin|nr:MAG TPA: GroEL [Caudoviricetes sp.]